MNNSDTGRLRPCRVCGTSSTLFYEDSRQFYKCPNCLLIFTDKNSDLEFDESFYKGQWENQDRAFWQNQAEKIISVLGAEKACGRILDFGAGSGALSNELKAKGCNVTSLEPMIDGYLKEQSYPDKFDAVVAVEVIEHLPNLWEEIDELEKVAADSAVLLFSTLLTNPFIEASDACGQFASWWYKDDPTHVSFFCNRTLQVMAETRDWRIEVYGNQMFKVKLK